MIPFEVVPILPASGGTPGAQAREALRLLAARGVARPLTLTFFVRSATPAQHRALAGEVGEAVREVCGADLPPFGVVAQAPEGGRDVALEAAVPAAAGARLDRRIEGGDRYSVIEDGEVVQVHAAGLGSDRGGDDVRAQAEDALSRAAAILAREGMDFGHVVRQWNYLERVLDLRRSDGRERQCYQDFNDVRADFYGRCSFPAGYPAATGIGQAAGGVIVEFVAFRASASVTVAPLTNPRQVDAHRYSEEVLVGDALPARSGKSPPMFERGKRVVRDGEARVFLSGTAAIAGERSIPGDVETQTRETLENLRVVAREAELTCLRAYVKREADLPLVRRVCEDEVGPLPVLCVVADVCRDELLVEIEGAARERASGGDR